MSAHRRILLLKYGQKLHFQSKRYVEIFEDGLIIYYSKPLTVKQKGNFRIIAPVESSLVPSLIKGYQICVRVKARTEKGKNKEFWLFPENFDDKHLVLGVIEKINEAGAKSLTVSFKLDRKELENKRKNSRRKRFSSQIHSKTSDFGLLSSSFEGSLDQKLNVYKFKDVEGSISMREHIGDSNDAGFEASIFKRNINEFPQAALIEDENLEEIVGEGCFPSEIKEFWFLHEKKPHTSAFEDDSEGKTVKKPRPLKIAGEEYAENEEFRGFLAKNASFFSNYHENKQGLSQRFVFPKREDSVNFEVLLGLELSDEFLLNLAEGFLWEFQLENAEKIFSLKPQNPDFLIGLLEISLMKVIVSGKRNLIDSTLAEISARISSLIPCDHTYMIFSELYMLKGMLYILLQSKFVAFLALKESYNYLKKAEKGIAKESNQCSYSRFLMINGAFRLGFSLLPAQYRKILEILGLGTDRKVGIQMLKDCITHARNRANFARLLLGLYYVEGDHEASFDVAFELIKDSLRVLGKSPLINWLASLFSWRFMQGSESIKLIMRSLSSVGGSLAQEAYYLKFELAWFELSHCQWASALPLFEELAIVSLDLFKFDEVLFAKIRNNVPLPVFFTNLLKKAKTFQNSTLENYGKGEETSTGTKKGINNGVIMPQTTIVMPHRNTLALLIAVCYISLNEPGLCELWLVMIEYIGRKFSNDPLHSATDIEVASLGKKFRRRNVKFFIKYEVLYFLKEIAKLKDQFLLQINANIHEFFVKTFEIEANDHNRILASGQKFFIMNEYCSFLFLQILIHCLLRNFDEVLAFGGKMREIIGLIQKDYEYLLHHGFHWVGRSLIIREKKTEALFFFKLSKKYQDCEFSLKTKNSKYIKEAGG